MHELETSLSILKRKQRNAKRESAADFGIQICTKEGRLLSEYTLSRRRNQVASLSAAERHVRKRLASQDGEALIIVISENTADEFRQTQSQISFDSESSQTATDSENLITKNILSRL